MGRPPVHAIVWDFDNTLVDTSARNRSVTRRIVAALTGRDPDEFPALLTQGAYDRALHRTQNWQKLYELHLGLGHSAIREAGRLWTRYQLTDDTPTRWFTGIPDVVRKLGGWPQGIVSMNTRTNIEAALARRRLRDAFALVVGCEEVGYERQKPDPEGLLHCLAALTDGGAGTVFYIGDHPVDAECAHNANRTLERQGRAVRVVSIGVAYGTRSGDEIWPVEPMHRVHSPAEIQPIIEAVANVGTRT